MATILLVDDNPTDRRLIATVLRPAGHRILEAGDGEEGLAIAHAERPDLVVTDIIMPTMDGYRFARLLRSDPATAHTRLLFNSASSMDGEIVELSRACGAYGVLPKPSEPKAIMETIAGALVSAPVQTVPDEQFDRQHLRVITDRLFAKVQEADERRREEERLRARLERRVVQQEALAAFGRRTLASTDLNRIFDDAVETAVRVLQIEHAKILELLPGGEELLLRTGLGWASGVVGTATVDAVGDSQAAYTLRTGGPVAVADLATEPRFTASPLLREHGIVGGISAVIGVGSRPFGVLGVHSTRPRAMDSDDVAFVQGMANVVADAVRRAQTDEVMRRSERMESLGRLAGGVAHDFNNLLAVISGYAALIQERVHDETVIRDLGRVQQASERAAGLVRQLLVFSRREAAKPSVVDLVEAVRDIAALVGRTIGGDVELVTRLPEVWPVVADRVQVDQVVLNLVVNARDAMPRGGTLTLSLENVTVTSFDPIRLDPGRYVRLTVADTGSGMTPEVRARAFEPFFTTKDEGKGTGLGLATIYGIATEAGGGVDVDSAPGRGTAVHVYLPAQREA